MQPQCMCTSEDGRVKKRQRAGNDGKPGPASFLLVTGKIYCLNGQNCNAVKSFNSLLRADVMMP